MLSTLLKSYKYPSLYWLETCWYLFLQVTQAFVSSIFEHPSKILHSLDFKTTDTLLHENWSILTCLTLSMLEEVCLFQCNVTAKIAGLKSVIEHL